jgi:predicted DNA-binding protein with PD1-like motif
MQSREKDNTIIIRFFQDEDFYEKLKEVCKIHNVKNAIVLSGLGQLKKFKLGFFKYKGSYNVEKFDDSHELLSLTGNICKQNGDYELHLHAVLGNEKKNAIGGHLIEGKVAVTNEIVILKTYIDITRKFEEKTGLKGLFLE